MVVRDFYHQLSLSLEPLYGKREAAAVVRCYLLERLGWQRHELALRGDEVLPEWPMFQSEIERLKNGEPVQYVLGITDFYDLRFIVTPNTLIPRPETEEIVQRVIEEVGSRQVNIWDVGTGSGCIAVTLAKHLPNANLFATDVSEHALNVAQLNAQQNNVTVRFARHDMCDAEHLPFGDTHFDVLVSNPPYIPQSMCAQMHDNVRKYEPALALFVPDDQPLLFYEALVTLGRKCLVKGGVLHAETYEDFHQETLNMLSENGYGNISFFDDLNGRPRAFRSEID